MTERPSARSPNVVWEGHNIPLHEREARNGQTAFVLWFTGLSGSGKSTIAREHERYLFNRNYQTALLDGDALRHGLNSDLAFGPEDRQENIRRAGQVARLFFEHGMIVLCSFVSPYQVDRDTTRQLFPPNRFYEVYVDCPLEILMDRDPKGLYKRAQAGEISNFTGLSAPYEIPPAPELTFSTDIEPIERILARLVERLALDGLLKPGRS